MANNDNVVPTQVQPGELTTKMNILNPIIINGKKFRSGQNVEVPKAYADDVSRMDYEASQAKANLVRQPKEYMVPVGINPLTGQRWED